MTKPDPINIPSSPLPTLKNSLVGQSGRYYRLHQNQPVAWQVWSDETFLLAQKYNKPILLSIGYSACHWCHVMSRESFADIDTASLMNDNFINICIDREERPDIDAAYQIAHILLNGFSGGWPLIAFLCPNTRLPFFSGTYLSQQTTAEKLGFPQLLQRVHDYYQQQPTDMRRLLMQLQAGIEKISQSAGESEIPGGSLLSVALSTLEECQDNENGGFGSSPKFPQPVNLGFLLYCHADGSLGLEQVGHLSQTLTVIAERGINDRVSGGFYRYSVDEAWTRPHYEKMLYDNGLLLDIYARAYEQFQDPLYRNSVYGIARWLRRYMLSPNGAFYNSVDADADEVEGGHYLISLADIDSELSEQELTLFNMLFAFERQSGESSGLHLGQVIGLDDCAREFSLTADEVLKLYESGRRKLEYLRQKNPPAAVDEKIITGWNALMIKGLAVSARITGEQSFLKMAQAALDFVHEKLWLNQRLFACWQDDKVTGHAFLDDYAYLIDALLELLQTDWRDSDYRFLLNLTEAMLHFHQDTEHGGLFYSAVDAEKMIYSQKPFMDAVMPAATAIAAKVLLRAGHLAAEPRYLSAAEDTFRVSADAVIKSPATHLSMVRALEEQRHPPAIVILADDGEVRAWTEVIKSEFGSRVFCVCLPPEAELYPPNGLQLEPGEGVVCVGEECFAVQRELNGLLEQLRQL